MTAIAARLSSPARLWTLRVDGEQRLARRAVAVDSAVGDRLRASMACPSGLKCVAAAKTALACRKTLERKSTFGILVHYCLRNLAREYL